MRSRSATGFHVRARFLRPSLLLLVAGLVSTASAQPLVNQSARGVPLVDEVDIVVVGGSTGAVAAAIEAASAGAEVYLVAPYPYLGEDMTATLRLWLEEGEVPTDPLAVQIFDDDQRRDEKLPQDRLPFTYQADKTPNTRHRDTPSGRLSDGACANASSESVQYDGDVTIVADLQKPTPLGQIALLAFHRAGASERAENFKVKNMVVSTSDDKQTWETWGSADPSSASVADDNVIRLLLEGDVTARYVKLEIRKADDVDRILLGEILILPPAKDVKQDKKQLLAPRPMHVKRTLDNALLDAGVKFIYSTYVTDIIRNDSAQPCGVVTVNRAGRQAILADVVIDATPRASVARMAGAKFTPYPTGTRSLQYVVIGGEPQDVPNGSFKVQGAFQGVWPNPAETASGTFPIVNYSVAIEMPDASWDSWNRAENSLRDTAFHKDQQFTADAPFEVPPDPVVAQDSLDATELVVSELPLAVLQPNNVANLFVLGGCADVSREAAGQLLRPLNLIALGKRVGAAAAALAEEREGSPAAAGITGLPQSSQPAIDGDLAEVLIGMRPVQQLPTIPDEARAIPVLGSFDVVVVGGGTTGAPAGISAARAGAKTLVVEFLHTLGGVGTTGAISSYYWGNRVGFTASVPGEARWIIEQKMNFWRSELLNAGGTLWFGTLGCGAVVDGNTVKGVIVATPQGRGVVLAKTVIDATGNSDIAYAAGAACMYTDEKELAVQGTGLPPRQLGARGANTDFTIVDETDAVDVWHVFIYSKDKYPNVFDQGKLLDTRERRRIVGDFVMNLLDQLNHRTYPDTVSMAYSNFDTHGYTVDPYLELEHPEKIGHFVSVPYRCTLPRGLEGILVGGLGISCHRDAIPLVRMQADMQNLGYALGWAAAMAASQGIVPRKIDVTQLQQHLIEIGNLPESVLQAKDSYEVTDQQLVAAVKTLPDDFQGIHVVMWADPEKAHAAVLAAFEAATDAHIRAAYGQVLAVMGDPIGVPLLIEKVESFKQWDLGWNYRGMGQFGSALSPLDRLIVALGRSGDVSAVPVIVKKMESLRAEHDFSHHRACALALELLGDPAAAKPLAEHLMKPGMRGFVHDTLEKARQLDAESPGGKVAVKTRRDSTRELAVARALFRCGDYGDLGRETLEKYVDDLRGHFSRHAKAVLDTPQKKKRPL
jgi:hypothetical protein